MLNHIVLMGRLTRDPELRRTGSGTPVASFTIAVDRDFTNQESGQKETDFIEIVAWRNTAEFVFKYFTKGRMAVVDGRLQIRNWQDKNGNKRKSAEVVADHVYFGDSKKEGDAPAQRSGYDGEYDHNGGYGGTGYPAGSYAPPQPSYGQQQPSYGSQDYAYPPGSDFPGLDDDSELPF